MLYSSYNVCMWTEMILCNTGKEFNVLSKKRSFTRNLLARTTEVSLFIVKIELL